MSPVALIMSRSFNSSRHHWSLSVLLLLMKDSNLVSQYLLRLTGHFLFVHRGWKFHFGFAGSWSRSCGIKLKNLKICFCLRLSWRWQSMTLMRHVPFPFPGAGDQKESSLSDWPVCDSQQRELKWNRYLKFLCSDDIREFLLSLDLTMQNGLWNELPRCFPKGLLIMDSDFYILQYPVLPLQSLWRKERKIYEQVTKNPPWDK